LQRILIVDDDAAARRLVMFQLRRTDVGEVLEAADGLEAQRLLETHEIDVVITDLVMPKLDGLGLMRWAKAERPDTAWIVLSVVEPFDAAVEAIQLGAFDFIAKPPTPERLHVSVRNVLEHVRLERERKQLITDLELSRADLGRKVEQLEALCGVLEHQADEIRRDLQRAESIQRALLPCRLPSLGGFHVESFYRPGHHVGGDLFDVAAIDGRRAALVVADACGHGVSAAMLSVLFKQRLRLRDEDSGEPLPPGRALAEVNEAIADAATPGMFVTAAYGQLDTETGEVVIASAGHPPVLWGRGGGVVESIPRTGPALGVERGAHYEETRIQLDRGDRLLFFTDGVLGAQGAGFWRVRDALAHATSPTAILDALREGALAAAEGGEVDDATALVLEARIGMSRFEAEATDAGTPRVEPRSELFAGVTPAGAWLRVVGRGTWREAEGLQAFAHQAALHRRSLVLDFGACETLDSTFLGAVHEAVRTVRAAECDAWLQGVEAPLRALFEELSMHRVIERIRKGAAPLPATLEPLERPAPDPTRTRQQLLRAHEALATLSPRNRREFRAVIEALRDELERSPAN
jgi:serine phosphatase RsbU (regulator of sigma subunit)/anti-anti-sigma regulatory factor